jgi:hypothetical protein
VRDTAGVDDALGDRAEPIPESGQRVCCGTERARVAARASVVVHRRRERQSLAGTRVSPPSAQLVTDAADAIAAPDPARRHGSRKRSRCRCQDPLHWAPQSGPAPPARAGPIPPARPARAAFRAGPAAQDPRRQSPPPTPTQKRCAEAPPCLAHVRSPRAHGTHPPPRDAQPRTRGAARSRAPPPAGPGSRSRSGRRRQPRGSIDPCARPGAAGRPGRLWRDSL